jgi:hypothetical protein
MSDAAGDFPVVVTAPSRKASWQAAAFPKRRGIESRLCYRWIFIAINSKRRQRRHPETMRKLLEFRF